MHHKHELLSSLELNQVAAHKANAYARRLITGSKTSGLLSAQSYALIAQGQSTRVDEEFKLEKRIVKMRCCTLNTSSSLVSFFRIFDYRTPDLFIIKDTVTRVKQFSVGNCGEYARLVLNHLRKQKISHAELFCITNGDHAFVVIGRDANSNPEDPDTWGPNAVVCDSWLDQIYPASTANLTMNMDFFDPQIHRWMLTESINGHHTARKEQAMHEAQNNLNVLRATINELILTITHTRSSELRDEMTSILSMIEHSIAHISAIKNAPAFETDATTCIERHLSKMVIKPLKRILALRLEPETHEKLTQALIDGWYVLFHQMVVSTQQEVPRYLLKMILRKSSEEVALRLITQIDIRLLEKTLELPDTLLFHFIHITTQKQFHTLLAHISPETLMRLDRPEYVPSFEGKDASLLHYALQARGESRRKFFMALLEKYNADALHAICQNAIATEYLDMKLPNLTLLYCSHNEFIQLMNKLRPDTVQQALDDLQHYPFEEESSAYERQLLLGFIKQQDAFIRLLNIYSQQKVTINFEELHFNDAPFRQKLRQNADKIIDPAMKGALIKRMNEFEPHQFFHPASHRFRKIFRDMATNDHDTFSDPCPLYWGKIP